LTLAPAISETPFFSTYIVEKNSFQIGIACINSAWRAYGGEDDYGKLLIGERAIDNCGQDLASCDFRIGLIHHPFSALAEFERSELQTLVSNRFHLWLRGHTHQNETELTFNLRNQGTVVVKGGALYQSRTYPNGYAIINCKLEESGIDVYPREYQDRARKFVHSPHIDSDYVTYTLSLKGLGSLDENTTLITRLRTNIESVHNKVILPPVESLGGGLSLADVFVEPPLAEISEYAANSLEDPDKKSEVEYYCLVDLLESDSNLLFIGKKENGKTTLLNYISHLYAEGKIGTDKRIPLLMNYRLLPKGKNRVYKALNSYLIDMDLEFDLKLFLQRGECSILVDDLNIINRKSFKALREFIREYPDNRYIIAANEDLFSNLQVGQEIDLVLDFNRISRSKFHNKGVATAVI
jgi:hypothetical protein